MYLWYNWYFIDFIFITWLVFFVWFHTCFIYSEQNINAIIVKISFLMKTNLYCLPLFHHYLMYSFLLLITCKKNKSILKWFLVFDSLIILASTLYVVVCELFFLVFIFFAYNCEEELILGQHTTGINQSFRTLVFLGKYHSSFSSKSCFNKSWFRIIDLYWIYQTYLRKMR